MDLDTLDVYLVFDLFMLLLIGMGPKIALVPFLDLTKGMEADAQRQVADRMVRTAVGTALLLVVIGLVLLVGALDFAVFRNMDKLAKHLDPSRLVITEAVFGVLLSALAVQLFVDGLGDLGIIAAIAH